MRSIRQSLFGYLFLQKKVWQPAEGNKAQSGERDNESDKEQRRGITFGLGKL